jgi:xylan 1,4-beta-xylosidase
MPLVKPAGANVGNGMPLSDDFSSNTLGLQWEYAPQFSVGRDVRFGDGGLTLVAAGEISGDAAVSPDQATMLSVRPVNHSYEVQVELTIPAGAEAGMLLDSGSGPRGSGGWADVGLRPGKAIATWAGQANYLPFSGSHIFLKLRNVHYDITCYYSADGSRWVQFPNATRVTEGRRIALYAAGSGSVVFHNFIYRGID